MRGLPSDSYQNGVCHEKDNGELIGQPGWEKKSFQEDVLQQAREGEEEKRKEKRENALLLQWPVADELRMSDVEVTNGGRWHSMW